MGDDQWLRTLTPNVAARRRLVCFPHAGGSANFFRSWVPLLSPDVALVAVQYPGRADRLREPCATSLLEMAAEVAESLRAAPAQPTTLFGHSMGAIVAYEVARLLESFGHSVERMVVSASRAPHERDGVASLDVWNDDAALRALVSLGGTVDDPELLADPRVRALVLPYLRADYTMLQRYRHPSGAGLGCELLVVSGESDTHVTPDHCARWADLTHGRFAHVVRPGGHFYLAPDPPTDLFLGPLPDGLGRSSSSCDPLDVAPGRFDAPTGDDAEIGVHGPRRVG
ncbi:alpha/beta fold hydrolase [Micromonospora sp. DR5-3]|uniref:thioesterase II family protein n=1 Tax=unclassified Micromonospora TaxID=2617518 RepID=UPI0011D6BBAE|nr:MULTISPECIES: alpha/beta fold hydrolase [unclassified Micromonospora]MCW3815803.1 alpha/beta fold hydrolase [Micromonospora sp. DR5-3]TYC21214.1 thioesterase [Micromonospora sp. MP36]